jgi:hypothetical protein
MAFLQHTRDQKCIISLISVSEPLLGTAAVVLQACPSANFLCAREGGWSQVEVRKHSWQERERGALLTAG